MARSRRIRVESRLEADAASLWDAFTNFRDINAELWPVHMSGPTDRRLDASVPVGKPLFRSWVTLFGFVPLDLHELALVEVVDGERFHEHSRSLLERHWIHRRSLTPLGPRAARVEDDVEFEPRIAGALVERIVALTFARRHRHLRARFGGDDPRRVVVERLSGPGASARGPSR